MTALNKSYKLLRFLNRRHSAASRHALAAAGWLGAMACTREPTLARALAHEFRANRYELAFRRAARYARRVSRQFNVLDDPFFNFTQNTTQAERDALLRSLQRRQPGMPPAEYLTDKLYILAANIHHALERGHQPETTIARFYKLADQALDLAKSSDAMRRSAPKPVQASNFNRAQARQALRDLAQALPMTRWRWFIISGTFLGLHRENGFLAHDVDIDTGIHAQGLNVEHLLSTIRASGLFAVKKLDHHVEVVRHDDGSRSLRKRPAMIKLIHHNGMQVDIFIHYTEHGKCWHGSIIHRWENTPFRLVQRELEGMAVLAPENAELYLTENYGDWRTPVKNYDCTTGTPNLVISANFISHALFVKRYLHFAAHVPRQAQKLLPTLVRSGVFEQRATSLRLATVL